MDDGTFSKWIVAIAGTLAVSAIIAGVGSVVRSERIQVQVQELQRVAIKTAELSTQNREELLLRSDAIEAARSNKNAIEQLSTRMRAIEVKLDLVLKELAQ